MGLGCVAMGELVEYLASFRKVKGFSGQTNRLGTKGQGVEQSKTVGERSASVLCKG